MFLRHGPLAFFYQSTSFYLSHYKIYWTTSVVNVGFKIRLLGTSNPMITLIFFPLVLTKVVIG